MTKNSFCFGHINSVDEWGLKVIAHDCFLPPKRARKVTVPGRSGAYDYGSDGYDERTLTMECVLERPMSKAAFREIIYALSRKDKITLWDEPEKFYTGELFDTGEVTVYPMEALREFELSFLCAPFAQGKTKVEALSSGHNRVPYRGTVGAPSVITLRNDSPFPVSNIVVTAIKRRV